MCSLAPEYSARNHGCGRLHRTVNPFVSHLDKESLASVIAFLSARHLFARLSIETRAVRLTDGDEKVRYGLLIYRCSRGLPIERMPGDPQEKRYETKKQTSAKDSFAIAFIVGDGNVRDNSGIGRAGYGAISAVQ